MAESSAFQTVEIWGWSALYSPQTLGLLVVLIVWLAYTFRRQHLLAGDTDARSSLMCSSGLALCLTLVVAQSAMLSREAGLAPLAISATALLLCTLVASIALSRTRNPRQGEGIAFVPATLLFVATIPIVGLPVASASFLLLFFSRQGIILRYAVGMTVLAIVAQLGLLAIFLDFSVEKLVMGLFVWHLLGH